MDHNDPVLFLEEQEEDLTKLNCSLIVFRKEDANIRLATSKSRAVKEAKTDSKKDVKKAGDGRKDNKDKAFVESKFETYFNFSVSIKSVKPYQVSTVYCIQW